MMTGRLPCIVLVLQFTLDADWHMVYLLLAVKLLILLSISHQIDERIGMWWRSDFETLPFPYLPPNLRRPKVCTISCCSVVYKPCLLLLFCGSFPLQECTKLFLVKLPMTRHFIVPRNLKLLAVPLCQLHDNSEV